MKIPARARQRHADVSDARRRVRTEAGTTTGAAPVCSWPGDVGRAGGVRRARRRGVSRVDRPTRWWRSSAKGAVPAPRRSPARRAANAPRCAAPLRSIGGFGFEERPRAFRGLYEKAGGPPRDQLRSGRPQKVVAAIARGRRTCRARGAHVPGEVMDATIRAAVGSGGPAVPRWSPRPYLAPGPVHADGIHAKVVGCAEDENGVRQEQRQPEHHVAPHRLAGSAGTRPQPRRPAPPGEGAAVMDPRPLAVCRSRTATACSRVAPGRIRSSPRAFEAPRSREDEPGDVLPVARCSKALARTACSAGDGAQVVALREEVVSLPPDQASSPGGQAHALRGALPTGVRIGRAWCCGGAAGTVRAGRRWRLSRAGLAPHVAGPLAGEAHDQRRAVREVPVRLTPRGRPSRRWKFAAWSRGWAARPEAARPAHPDARVDAALPAQRPVSNWRSTARPSRIRPRRLHRTRHTFVSLAIDDGARFDVVQRITYRGRCAARSTSTATEGVADTLRGGGEAPRCPRASELPRGARSA